MAIRAKPQSISLASDERRVNALIEKGGTVPEGAADDSRRMLVQLRLSPELIKRIDKNRRKRTVPPSRHAWILEALLDKLSVEQ
ncbi:MAG TPA: hypothetical protein VMF50_06870 [Candidatus Binataceae bacterium]|nr:hypothetical protein [Candidatus Binataceae bacterium]